jgi:hypothetical protein
MVVCNCFNHYCRVCWPNGKYAERGYPGKPVDKPKSGKKDK